MISFRRVRRGVGIASLAVVALAGRANGQDQATRPGASLSLADARRLAFAGSADLTAMKESVAAARGRERQAGVLANPVLSFGREQASGGSPSQTSSQNILAVDQTLDWSATRSARVEAARLRRQASEARVDMIETQIAYDVARAYAAVIVADRRVALADEAARAFDNARVTSERRLAAGDVAGFAVRRIRLESARYATLRAEAQLAQRSARLTLSALVSPSADSVIRFTATLTDSLIALAGGGTTDTLTRLALTRRADLRAAELEVQAAAADARLARRERTPVPTFSAGLKTERAPGVGSLVGFIAGVAVPLPVWDKRIGSIDAADAEIRRRNAELLALRRRIAKEVAEAAEAFRASQDQIVALGLQVEIDAAAAFRSAQTAYTEGDITLLEWLDAVRAYQETQSFYSALRADLFIRHATLERAVGVTFPGSSR